MSWPAAGWAETTATCEPGHEALVVEPVQEIAVVLGEADDLAVAADRELREGDELGVLGLLELRYRPASRAGSGRDVRAGR